MARDRHLGDARGNRRNVLRLVLEHGSKLMLAGVVLGLVPSFFLTRFLSAFAPRCNQH
jgi:hypothetical protein